MRPTPRNAETYRFGQQLLFPHSSSQQALGFWLTKPPRIHSVAPTEPG
jgi:hypothetical protein